MEKGRSWCLQAAIVKQNAQNWFVFQQESWQDIRKLLHILCSVCMQAVMDANVPYLEVIT